MNTMRRILRIGYILSAILCLALALHQVYHEIPDEHALATAENFSSDLPSIHFVDTHSHLLHQDKITVVYKLKNIPTTLINDGRVRVGLWVCYFWTEGCSKDENFDVIYYSISQESEETTNKIIGTFGFKPFDLNVRVDGRYRLRLVLDIINPLAPGDLKPNSPIRQFMDELTVLKEKFEMPTVDIWRNEKVPIEYLLPESLGVQYFNGIQTALNNAFLNSSGLSEAELDVLGFSGSQFRHFYNNLGALLPGDIHYLEIGIYAGSTMVSLLSGNGGKVRTVVGVDMWTDGDWLSMSTVKKMFDSTLERYIDRETQFIHIIQADCWKVSPNALLDVTKGQKFNLYLYDGPHAVRDHFFALVNFFPALADTFILVVDDWNWDWVRAGTESGLAVLSEQLLVLGKVELLTGDHPPKGVVYPWHNGMAVFVIQKVVSESRIVDATVQS